MSEPPPEQNEQYALIIDDRSNLARRIAQLIHDMIGVVDEEQFKLFVIGSSTPIPLTSLRQSAPPTIGRQSQPCSLIAPIMETLVREGRKRSVIIIGGGQIFDLDDWVDHPSVDGWLLVRTGEQSLQGPDGRISEITVEQIGGDADTLLSYLTRFPPPETEPRSCNQDEDGNTYEWRIDATGYPLVFVEPVQAYVQLFPVTKPQFEKFISSSARREYGDEWYHEIIKLNPRASFRSTDVPEREQLFMTGVMAVETLAFARWLGRHYALLTAQEWVDCHKWFGEQTAPCVPPDLRDRLSRDALGIWEMVREQWLELNRQPTLRELSLMTRGILEWVVERPGRYCGLGDPSSSRKQRKVDDPVYPIGQGRIRNIGFRLCTR